MNKNEEKKVEENELNEDNLNEVSGGTGTKHLLEMIKKHPHLIKPVGPGGVYKGLPNPYYHGDKK